VRPEQQHVLARLEEELAKLREHSPRTEFCDCTSGPTIVSKQLKTRVRVALQGIDRELQPVAPKAARSRRTIPLHDLVVEALRAAPEGDRLGGPRSRLLHGPRQAAKAEERAGSASTSWSGAPSCRVCGLTTCGTSAHRSCCSRACRPAS
jgi:hypothetical protein